MFIIVSTFFLMPIRLLGFFRLAHASGWGTRAGAYAGGPMETEPASPVPGMDRAPVSPIDRVDEVRSEAVDAEFERMFEFAEPRSAVPAGEDVSTKSTATVLATRRETARETRISRKAAAAPVKRVNPYAMIPYLIGVAIFVLEALTIV
jgi:hyaluronan synthase